MKKKIVIVSAAPFGGGDTLAKHLESSYGHAHFGMGETYRKIASPRIRRHLERGELVPDDDHNSLFCHLWEEFFRRNFGKEICLNKALRSPGQAGLVSFIRSPEVLNSYDIIQVFIDVEKREVERRFEAVIAGQDLNRRGRVDDKRVVFTTRWKEYVHKTIPAINAIEGLMCVKTIRIQVGYNQPKEEMLARACFLLGLSHSSMSGVVRRAPLAFVH